MTNCQHCKRPCQLFLCTDCTTLLANMLDEIPWLMQELDARIQRLDRISSGTVGRSRRPDEMNVMDFDAAETSREVRKLLLKWVTTVAEKHTGRVPPGLSTVSTPNLARWLKANVDAIARLNLARKGRHPLYDDINRLVSTSRDGGTLHKTINRTELHAAGPCPTIVGRHHDGTPRQCETMLFADTYDRNTTCPECGQTVDVEDNRRRAAAERDLHARADLIEVLANIDEPVTDQQVDRWIRAKRLRPLAYREGGAFKANDQDEPLYSIERARKLRRRELNSTWRTRRWVNA